MCSKGIKKTGCQQNEIKCQHWVHENRAGQLQWGSGSSEQAKGWGVDDTGGGGVNETDEKDGPADGRTGQRVRAGEEGFV